jgi:3-oxoacyl-[acyl-carrier-protein] synthase III
MENIGIIGLECEYPEFKYSTKELIDLLGDRLTEKVKENIYGLGVNSRHFIRPIEQYIGDTKEQINLHGGPEPISDFSAEAAKKCMSNLGLKPENITSLIVASENSDYQSPGMASIVVTKAGLSNFIPHYNIQGMACSTLPKVLELGKNLIKNENDKVLVIISGCNSGWYLPHLRDGELIQSPGEIKKDDPNREKQLKKWVSTMFSFLFGDGVTAFVLSGITPTQNAIKIGKITHGINFDESDYKKASVKLVGQKSNQVYEYELTAGSDILPRTLEYSKKVLMRSLGKDIKNFDKNIAESYMAEQEKIMIHTGSSKILNGLKNLYNLKDTQIKESFDTLSEYGNLTGVSLPTVMNKALYKNELIKGKCLLVGITMGFGVDMVEVEKN